MTRTILFDLDDTLLENSMEAFIPAYLRNLSEAMSGIVDAKKMLPVLMSAVQAMSQNLDLRFTLRQVFDQTFYPALRLDPVAAQPAIDQFYAEVFPSLKQHTRLRPASRALVTSLLELGDTLAVSTNPLFPRTAILQRLEWAGFAPAATPFHLVASMEDFHFTKPHPEFFAEVLACLGWPDGPVVIVGDDPVNDIQPANQLGIASFQVRPSATGATEGQDLSAFQDWLRSQSDEDLIPRLEGQVATLAIIRTAHAGASQLCRDFSVRDLGTRPAESEWSATEILCHFRDVDREVTLPRLDSIRRENNPFIAAANPDEWAEPRNYRSQAPEQVLQDWLISRCEVAERLAALEDADWYRPARHTIFGPTTISELMQISARHDKLHIQQLCQTLDRVAQNSTYRS